jgi:hypothetical protein
VLSLLAIGGLWAGALLMTVFGLLGSLGAATASGLALQEQAAGLLLFAAGMFACGILLLPSVFYAWRRLAGKPVASAPRLPVFLRPTVLILVLPLVLLAGYWIAEKTELAWLFLPGLHILAVGLPVLFLVYLARRHLPAGSPQRTWGVFDSGLVLGPFLILILETIAFVVFAGLMFVFIARQTDLVAQLSGLSEQFLAGAITPEELVGDLAPVISQPWVVLAAIFFVSLIVPLIEEALKPIGVWLLAGFGLSPAAGFSAGALSGAGYAFFESLALASSSEDWAILVAVRSTTAVIHILNTALMGWALASTWQDKKYLRLGLTYAGVVAFHGVWNALAVLNAVDTLLSEFGLEVDLPIVSWLGTAGPFVIGLMTLIAFAVLLWMNRRLRQTAPAASALPKAQEQGMTA